MKPVITLENVRKSYPGFELDIPRFEVPKGYITGVIGENGAGKTTTLRMIMDLIAPDSGDITVLDSNMASDGENLKQQIGYVDSLAYFSPTFKVGMAKKIVAPFYRDWDENLYQSYVKRYNIREDKKLKDLSSGQNKLFSLVMALCHRPKLLILDEPTTALDPVIRSELLDILADLLQDGEMSVLFSTHITSDLEKTADYIAYIHEGRLLLHEEKDALLERFRLVKGDNNLLPRARPMLTGARETSVGFTGLTHDAEGLRELFGDSVLLERPTLEDIMIYTAKGANRDA